MLIDNIHTWAGRHPTTLDFFHTLNKQHIPWGFFSGFLVDLVGGRVTDDHDLLVSNDGFDAVADLLPNVRVTKKEVTIACGDGETVEFITEEATGRLDERDIQVMRPALMTCSNGGEYYLSLTRLAACNRICYRVGGVAVYLAPAFDTIAAKSLMQRKPEEGKHDAYDTAVVAAHYPISMDYAYARAEEIGLNERADRFVVRHAGFTALRALEPQLALV